MKYANQNRGISKLSALRIPCFCGGNMELDSLEPFIDSLTMFRACDRCKHHAGMIGDFEMNGIFWHFEYLH